MIENKGIAPTTAFTRLGDSGSRNRDGRFIGQFGTGAKHAINIFLRKGIACKICTDGTTLEFFFEVEHVTDADGNVRESYPVYCQCKGKSNRKIECGWDLNFGGIDWTDTSMGLREVVSNAIDWAKACGGTPEVTVADNVRNRAGYTRIFVSYDDQDVKLFHRDLGKTFLQFSGDPDRVNQRFLPKSPETLGPTIYREGVKVATLKSKVPAAFDYNFRKGEIAIDECRNSSEYALRARIAQAINKAPRDVLKKFFAALSQGNVYEATLDDYYLGYASGDDEKENWTDAWEDFAGDAVLASEAIAASPLADHAKKKGHSVIKVKSDAFVKVARSMGVKDVTAILGNEGSGKIECEATDEAYFAVDEVWGWVEAAGLTTGKPKPQVRSFKQIMSGESECLGDYLPGTDYVRIREDVGGKLALKTAIEEVTHYITGATDLSRDFQNYAFDMIVELCT
jgi:hypothetical protein